MKLKRLLAGALSAAMLLSVSSSLAFADASDPTDNLDGADYTFTSTMSIGDGAITAPAFSYTYAIASADAETYTITDNGVSTTTYVLAGAADSAIISESATTGTSASSDTASVDIAFDAGVYTDSKLEKTVYINFDATVFTAAGIYHYTLTETGEENTDGVVNQSEAKRVYDIYVTVVNTATEGTFAIEDIDMYTGAVTLNDESTAFANPTKADGYIHTYGIEDVEGEPNPTPTDGATQDFVVTDIAKGLMASKSKNFSFATVTLLDADESLKGMIFSVTDAYLATEDGTLGAQVNYVYVGADGVLYVATESEGSYDTTSTTKATFALSSGDTFTIENVIEGMTFQVTISDPLTEGYLFYAREYDEYYVAKADGDENEGQNAAWTSLAETSTDVPSVATYQNTVDADYTNSDDSIDNEGIDFATVLGDDADEGDDKGINYPQDSFPDTGVVLDLAPYAIMMVLALGAISFRFVRVARKTEE